MYLLPLSVLFFFLLIVDLYSETTRTDIVTWIIRPLLMPILIVLFLLHRQKTLRHEQTSVVLALGFSCLGDILLTLHGDQFFLFGLIAFLLAHISYIISFIIRLRNDDDLVEQRLTILSMILLSIPFFAYIAFMLTTICSILIEDINKTKALIAPLVIYALVIVSMAYISCLRNRSMSGFWCVVVGTFLFVMSDSFLAFDKFVLSIPLPGLLVMLTYGVGQYLITIGSAQITIKDFKIRRSMNNYQSI